MANTMPSLQHPFLQQRPSLSAFSHSSPSSTSIVSSSSSSSSSCRVFRVVGCHQTSAASPLNEANGNSESSDNQSTEISFEVPSKGRMAADALELLKDCQLYVRQFNPRLYVAQIPLISNLEVWFQRPKDVVRKLLSGDLDLGTVGYDTLNDGQTKGSILLRRSSKDNEFGVKSSFFIQMGLLAITQVAEPALAVTGVNYEEDLISVLIKAAIVAFGYFLIMPPIIMNWLRIRWYRRNLLEMYLQFMCVFLFFPGVLLWAPFLNFRKFPRDPTMKYPWSKPENPSEVRGGFLKFPWATIEDYE